MNIHDELAQFLKTLRETKFVYIPNPGNAGDSLIAAATYQLFDRLLLNYELGRADIVYPDRTVIFGGGGNLIDAYPNAINFIRNNHRVCRSLVILPHTVSAYGDVLGGLAENCFIFCRELPSYDYVRKYARKAKVFLSHDIALAADIDMLKKWTRGEEYEYAAIKDNGVRDIKLSAVAFRHYLRSGFNFSTAKIFRDDAEKSGIPLPAGNFDISDVYATRDFSKSSCYDTTKKMIRFLSRYRSIETNRLHVCILALMLGKAVKFHSNSYYKNRAIYEHSLRDRFPNLLWCG